METVIMVGVIWNAMLQTYWFFWSREIHNRKHFSDEIDLHDKIKKYCDDNIAEKDTQNIWKEFVPLKTKEEILNNAKAYDPDEISGALDTLFKGSK
jgi:hypothetical protein